MLVSHRAVNDHADLERIARSIERDASDLRVSVLRDKPHWLRRARIAWQPTLVYSAKALRRLRPLRGAVLQGSRQSKIEEMEQLERAGIPVPRWRPVTRAAPPPDVTDFGPYVVMKPDRGGCGADVRIVRSEKVRFLDPSTRRATRAQRWIAQQYVHTGSWPIAQRVLTLCGTPLYAIRTRADARVRRSDMPQISAAADAASSPATSAAASSSATTPTFSRWRSAPPASFRTSRCSASTSCATPTAASSTWSR